MKKLTPLFLAALFVIAGTTAKSQNLQGQTVFNFNLGYSLTGDLIKGLFDEGTNSTIKVSPVIILGADYGLSEKFSIGASFTTQGMKGTITDNWWYDDNDSLITENFDFKIRRSHIAIIPKYHYTSDNDKLDIYSGLRLGFVMWSYKDDSNDPTFTAFDDLKGRVTVGFTTGMRYYFTDNIGANVDLNLGAPYVVSFGLNYKLGGN